jgi:hypothetical protein
VAVLFVSFLSGESSSGQGISATPLTSADITAAIGSDADARGAISVVLAHGMAHRSKREFFLATQILDKWLPVIPGVELVRLTDLDAAAHIGNCGRYWTISRLARLDNVVSLSLSQRCGGVSLAYIASFDGREWRLGPPGTGKDGGGWVPGIGSGFAGRPRDCPCL